MASETDMPCIAHEGYWHANTGFGGVMWINGVLHQRIQPIGGTPRSMWVPVRSYEGPVQFVDRDGRPCPAPTEAGGEGEGDDAER